MDKISQFKGLAAPLKISNVDTDQIIPAVFLKRITKTGFEDGLFANWRQNPDFVLNQIDTREQKFSLRDQILEPVPRASMRSGPSRIMASRQCLVQNLPISFLEILESKV